MNLSKYVTGGNFIVESMVSDSLTPNTLGVLLSVPEVSGKVYKIISLYGSTETVGNIRFTVNGDIMTDCDEISLGVFVDGATSTAFGVSRAFGVNNTLGHSRVFREIYCKSFEIRLLSGGSSSFIPYAYLIGSFS